MYNQEQVEGEQFGVEEEFEEEDEQEDSEQEGKEEGESEGEGHGHQYSGEDGDLEEKQNRIRDANKKRVEVEKNRLGEAKKCTKELRHLKWKLSNDASEYVSCTMITQRQLQLDQHAQKISETKLKFEALGAKLSTAKAELHVLKSRDLGDLSAKEKTTLKEQRQQTIAVVNKNVRNKNSARDKLLKLDKDGKEMLENDWTPPGVELVKHLWPVHLRQCKGEVSFCQMAAVDPREQRSAYLLEQLTKHFPIKNFQTAPANHRKTFRVPRSAKDKNATQVLCLCCVHGRCT
jgi:hypothetical protein